MQFIGPPFTFGVNMINEGIGCIGPKAMTNVAGGVYWMDYTGFYFYNGTVLQYHAVYRTMYLMILTLLSLIKLLLLVIKSLMK